MKTTTHTDPKGKFIIGQSLESFGTVESIIAVESIIMVCFKESGKEITFEWSEEYGFYLQLDQK